MILLNEFLDSFANQRQINIDRLQNALIRTISYDEKAEKIIYELSEIVKAIKRNEKIREAVDNEDMILPLKETIILMGLSASEFPKNVVYYMLSTVFSWGLSLLFIVAMPTQDIGVTFHYGFVLLGMLNFVFVILYSLRALNVKRNRRWEV